MKKVAVVDGEQGEFAAVDTGLRYWVVDIVQYLKLKTILYLEAIFSYKTTRILLISQ